jgi:uncharacterized protein YgiM (DUF1202 family)
MMRVLSGELTAGESFTLPGPLAQGYHQLTLSKGKKQWQQIAEVTDAPVLRRTNRIELYQCAPALLARFQRR